ncbi:HAD-IC family P-type ATPase, partial [Candidatus Dependentiae bacterium]|nr:HAD-IC family P-type ATPase [Candidatus Dependentiae bacterium]
GDPIEAAMLVFGQKMGINKDNLEKEKPIITDLFFDYTLRYHAVAYSEEKETKLLAVTGAPEAILTRCSQIWHNDETMSLSDSLKDELTKVFTTMSKQGLRVIACAEGAYTEQTTSLDKIQNLTFIAFFGMQDTLRSEVAQAMTQAKQAGIRVVMITGDHKLTAIAIAQEAGIYQEGNEIITGEELKILTAQQLAKKLPITSVFARVSPQDKLSIINGFKERGEIIAMTGDGVNDAPSLVAADLGVAMGNVGTEVAKEAADLVLLDDNFGNIVSAVEEGRSIHKTIKKVLLYLFAGGTCQVFTIFGGILLGYPLPLLAAQILWINFVTDGFLDIALAMEPTEANILHTTFEKLPRYIIDKLIIKRILLSAIPLALGTLYLFSLYVQHDLHKARTVTLTTLALGHLFCAWSFRSTHKSIFNWAQPVNNYLIMASLLIVSLQLTAIYTPFMQKILRTSALHYIDWLKILAIASLVIVFEEVRKIFNTPNA